MPCFDWSALRNFGVAGRHRTGSFGTIHIGPSYTHFSFLLPNHPLHRRLMSSLEVASESNMDSNVTIEIVPPLDDRTEIFYGQEFQTRYRQVFALSSSVQYSSWKRNMQWAFAARSQMPPETPEDLHPLGLLNRKIATDLLASIPAADLSSSTRLWMHLEARFGTSLHIWMSELRLLDHFRYKNNPQRFVEDFHVVWDRCKRSHLGTPTAEAESRAFLCAVSFHDSAFTWTGPGPEYPPIDTLIERYLEHAALKDSRGQKRTADGEIVDRT